MNGMHQVKQAIRELEAAVAAHAVSVQRSGSSHEWTRQRGRAAAECRELLMDAIEREVARARKGAA